MTTSIFILAWCIGALAWFLAVGESIGYLLFYPIVYRNGLRVFNENIIIPSPSEHEIGKIIITDYGKFKIISHELCLFRIKFPIFAFRIHTPFPIKGTINWSNGIASVEGRIPVFPIIFFSAWLIGWTIGGLMFISSEGITGIMFVLFGWIFVVAICLFSLPLETKRAHRIINEFTSRLTKRSS